MSDKKTYIIDGANFETLEEFYDEISRVLVPGVEWGRNLNEFNDILRGGFGTPESGFEIVWANSARSKEQLGFKETVRVLGITLNGCHSTIKENIQSQLDDAVACNGQTVYDWLVEIIEKHCVGGSEAEDGVELHFE